MSPIFLTRNRNTVHPFQSLLPLPARLALPDSRCTVGVTGFEHLAHLGLPMLQEGASRGLPEGAAEVGGLSHSSASKSSPCTTSRSSSKTRPETLMVRVKEVLKGFAVLSLERLV